MDIYLRRGVLCMKMYIFDKKKKGDEQKVMSALTYRDGSFIKVKNITLGYTLPQSVSRKVLMEKCRFYATAYNPFLYVKDKELREIGRAHV